MGDGGNNRSEAIDSSAGLCDLSILFISLGPSPQQTSQKGKNGEADRTGKREKQTRRSGQLLKVWIGKFELELPHILAVEKKGP